MKTCVDLVDYCVDWMESPKRPYWSKFDYLMWVLSVNMLYGIEDHFQKTIEVNLNGYLWWTRSKIKSNMSLL